MNLESIIAKVRNDNTPAFIWNAYSCGKRSRGYHIITSNSKKIQLYKRVDSKDEPILAGKTTSMQAVDKIMKTFKRGWNVEMYLYEAPLEWKEKYSNATIIDKEI